MKTILIVVCLVVAGISVGMNIHNWIGTPTTGTPPEVTQAVEPKAVEHPEVVTEKPQKRYEAPTYNYNRNYSDNSAAIAAAIAAGQRQAREAEAWHQQQVQMRNPGGNQTWGPQDTPPMYESTRRYRQDYEQADRMNQARRQAEALADQARRNW